MKNLLATMAILGMSLGGMAIAQPVPAEMPPADYSGRDFVDSKGCVFQRMVFSGVVGWVALLGADGEQVCAPVQPAKPDAEPAAAQTPAKETAPVAKPEKSATLPKGFWVQVGAFGQTANAEAEVAALKKMGFSVMTTPVKKGRFIAVLAGPFADRGAAAAALKVLQPRYPEAFTRP